jgi:hypothetical protein
LCHDRITACCEASLLLDNHMALHAGERGGPGFRGVIVWCCSIGLMAAAASWVSVLQLWV